MKKNILVTGGAGYIGSHACKALAQAGYTPIAYDNLVYGHEKSVKWGPFEKGDIADTARLSEIFAKYSPQAVMHFAAFAYVGESVENPAKYYQNNVAGSISLLKAMGENRVQRIVFSSSCAVYGIPESIPITEKSRRDPINPYGRSKMIVEDVLRDLSMAYGLKYVSLRYFNASGADPDGEIGEDHDPETHIIPLVLQSIIGKIQQFEIYGDDYETPDGTCIRDYIHVTDLANAHVLALKRLEKQGTNLVCNLGNGNGLSVKQIVENAEKVTGKKVPRKISARREGDPAVLVADASLAKKALGWQPAYPDVAQHIEHAWKWMNKQVIS